jgi:hypothetical protein
MTNQLLNIKDAYEIREEHDAAIARDYKKELLQVQAEINEQTANAKYGSYRICVNANWPKRLIEMIQLELLRAGYYVHILSSSNRPHEKMIYFTAYTRLEHDRLG